MGILNENANTDMGAALASGLASISGSQQISFTKYTKRTLSVDGFVFWVNSGASTSHAGSLHYGTQRDQVEDQTIGVNDVIFSSADEITEFNTIDNQTLWVAPFVVGAATILIAFCTRGRFYEAANVWHYSGNAVYPALQS